MAYNDELVRLGTSKLNGALAILAAVILGDPNWVDGPSILWGFGHLLEQALRDLVDTGIEISR